MLPGCLSDLIFGYSDEEIQALTDAYVEKVNLESEKKNKMPSSKKIFVEEYVESKKTLTLDLKNAVAFAATGKLLATHSQFNNWRPKPKYYGFEDVIEENSIVPAGNRNFLTRVENLNRFALGLANVKHDWNPQLNATVSFIYANNRIARTRTDTLSTQLAASATQLLPFGGDASLSFNLNRDVNVQPKTDKFANVSVVGSVNQPLLRKFGYARAHEDLVQAQRDFVFEVRNFELFRQDFTITVIQVYYDIIRRKQVIKNNQKAYEQASFVLNQTKALYESLGEKTAIDVLRAEFSEQQVKDVLDAEIEAYDEAIDAFKVFLGLSPSSEMLLQNDQPKQIVFSYNLHEAEKVAVQNRLDLRNLWEQIEDAARNLRYLRQDLLPNLDLFLNFTLADNNAENLDDFKLSLDNATAGITLEIPLDRVREKNDLKSAVIAFKQQVRDFLTALDNVRRDVRNDFRAVRRLKGSLKNQKRQIEIARKKERNALIIFKEGEISNRDLVDAQEELRDAENNYIQTLVDYEITRIQALRNMGILYLDLFGNIKE